MEAAIHLEKKQQVKVRRVLADGSGGLDGWPGAWKIGDEEIWGGGVWMDRGMDDETECSPLYLLTSATEHPPGTGYPTTT
jgi:hypothetical protein